jgi:hypothetical protein
MEQEPFPFDMPKTFFETITRYKEAVMREGKDLEKFKAKRMHTAKEKKHVPAAALERFAQLMDIDPDTYKATLTPDFTAEITRAKQMVDAIQAHQAQGGQHRNRITAHANPPPPRPPARWAGGEQGTPPAAPPIAFRQGRGLGRWGRQTSPLARPPARQALDRDDTTHPAAPRNEGAAGSGYGDRSWKEVTITIISIIIFSITIAIIVMATIIIIIITVIIVIIITTTIIIIIIIIILIYCYYYCHRYYYYYYYYY